jgi:NAD(P)-dependent dehydrogenase (short-subunit alcohol dehydrogenase family)
MDLNGKKILLTGGTSGLGLEVSRLLLSKGGMVCAMGRNLKAPMIRSENFSFIKSDFSDLNNVVNSVNDMIRLNVRFDIIINNAGVLSPPDYRETKDGFEFSFQVNYLSHLIINEMIMRYQAVPDPITFLAVTSPVYKHVSPSFRIPAPEGYRSFKTYSESKYYLLLMGDYLKHKFPESNFMFIGFNPGTFGSGIYRTQNAWFRTLYRIAAPFMRSPSGVASSLCSVLESDRKIFNGVYNGKKQDPSFTGYSPELYRDFSRRCSDIVKDICG